MIKLYKPPLYKSLLPLSGALIFGFIMLTHSQIAAAGVKQGLRLLSETLVPSLFPFMIISEYIAKSNTTRYLARHLQAITHKHPRISPYSFIALALGCTGGYPIGARVITEFKRNGSISPGEAAHLFYWCINPGMSFVITAVGTFMLGNTISGVIIYISCITSSILLGLFSAFGCKELPPSSQSDNIETPDNHIFIKSVSSAVESMLGICGWVLFFSTVGQLCNHVIHNESLKLFINCVAEVTNGCKNGISNGMTLPVICAIISFGGLAVASQISPHLAECNVPFKIYLGWRVAGSALSAFICSFLTRLFPQSATVGVVLTPSHTLTNGLPAALFMVLMCVVLIFEVDNKRGLC